MKRITEISDDSCLKELTDNEQRATEGGCLVDWISDVIDGVINVCDTIKEQFNF